MEGKWVHIVVFLLVALLAAGTIWHEPELRKGTAVTFGTITGFATIYGVLFTIIELLRTKAVAKIAANEAKKAAKSVASLYGMEHISECQSCIEFALSAIDKDSYISSSALSRIVKLYVIIFPTQYTDPESAYRQRVAIVESYASIDPKFITPPPGRLKQTLVGMMADLSVSSGSKIARA